MDGAGAAEGFSFLALFLKADIVVKMVMIGLALASVWSWAVAIDKFLQIRKLEAGARTVEATLAEGRGLDGVEDSPRAGDAMARVVAVVLAEAVEPSGWLGAPLAVLATDAGASLAEATAVLHKLQGIEPTGLFAQNLSDCLRLQAREAGLLDKALGIMLDNLDSVARGDFTRLAKLCEVTEPEIVRRLRVIRAMDPKPGAQFAQGVALVREPDLIAKRSSAGWEVALNRSALPAVRLDKPAEGSRDAATKTAWSAAQSVARMVAARNTTLLAVGAEVMRRQVAALDYGIGALAPLTMGDVALALDLHESTVSRVVSGTSIDTPRGTWWLKALFSGSMGGDVSAAMLRDRLARLVAGEDRAKPMSDEALALALSQGGVDIARRTVAKYRDVLNIPPAFRRRVQASAQK